MPILNLEPGKIQTGLDKYKFVERQDEKDVSGVLNYPNELSITLNRDVAWQLAILLLDYLRYSNQPAVELPIYGKLSENI